MKAGYESPAFLEHGTLEEMTEQNNKVGRTPDIYTAITNGAVIGSLVLLP